jgi:hypothetical protein
MSSSLALPCCAFCSIWPCSSSTRYYTVALSLLAFIRAKISIKVLLVHNTSTLGCQHLEELGIDP